MESGFAYRKEQSSLAAMLGPVSWQGVANQSKQHWETRMKSGDLVVMYGQRGFYGLVLERSSVVGRWNVLWQSGFIFEREESLMEVISESR